VNPWACIPKKLPALNFQILGVTSSILWAKKGIFFPHFFSLSKTCCGFTGYSFALVFPDHVHAGSDDLNLTFG